MQSIEMNLDNISIIRTGYTFREKIEGSLVGDISVIQPKDIINKQAIGKAAKIDRREINSLENHLLKSGDILITNKGLKFSTFLYTENSDDAVASSSFFVIRPDEKKIFPEYLAWYLQQEPTKDQLLNRVTGSIIPSINKSAVQQVVVLLPSLTIQEYIVKLLKISAEELFKLHELHERKTEFYKSHIWEKII